MSFVNLGQSAQFILREAKSVGSVKEIHSLIVVLLGYLGVEELVADRLVGRGEDIIVEARTTSQKRSIYGFEDAILLLSGVLD